MSLLRTAAALVGSLALLSAALSAPPTRSERPQPRQRPAGGFSLDAALANELRKIGQITPAEFARRYSGKLSYLEKLSWDPTTGKF